jgi:formylglycine-generating enzyme required for sulfatase activity
MYSKMKKFLLFAFSYLFCQFAFSQMLRKPIGIYFNQTTITEFTITNALKNSKLTKPYTPQDWEHNFLSIDSQNNYIESRILELRKQRTDLAIKLKKILTNQDVSSLLKLAQNKRDSLNLVPQKTQDTLAEIGLRGNYICVIRALGSTKTNTGYLLRTNKAIGKFAITELNKVYYNSFIDNKKGLFDTVALKSMLKGKANPHGNSFYLSLSSNKKFFLLGVALEVNPLKLDAQKETAASPVSQVVACINMLQDEIKIKSDLKKVGINEADITKVFQSYKQSLFADQTLQYNLKNLEEAKQINENGKMKYLRIQTEVTDMENAMTNHEKLLNDLLQSFNLPIGSGNNQQEVRSLTQFMLAKMKQMEDSILFYVSEKFEHFENEVNQTGNISLDMSRVALGGLTQFKTRKSVFGYLQFFKIKEGLLESNALEKEVNFTRDVKEFWMMPIQVRANKYKVGMIARYKIMKGNAIPDEDTTTCEACTDLQRKVAEEIASNMVSISGGTFMMGCNAGDTSCQKDEYPSHSVTLSDFKMSKFEVTQSQWLVIMNTKPSDFKGCEECPVEQVSWEDAQAFIAKLNKLTGKSYRLPSEAEWEYAAKAGKNDIFAGTNNLKEVAWFGDNSGNQTHAVGLLGANAFGLYDMSGNVWEWCNDWYGPYAGDDQINPQGPSNGLYRVIRGGSWNNKAKSCKVSARYNNTRTNRYFNLGFRLAQTTK